LTVGLVLNLHAGVTFTFLHSFGVWANGASPNGALIQGSNGDFYGTTPTGGTNGGWGTVFKINASGALTTLYSFTGGADGWNPAAPLVQGSDGNFYGTTYSGGSGTVFRISPGGALTTLYYFTGGDDGGGPQGALVQGSDGSFYGTTAWGGTGSSGRVHGVGTVFRITTNGVLTTLYSFKGPNWAWDPEAGLVQGSDGYFYGTTWGGGTNGQGTVFKINSSGAFTILHSFTGVGDGRHPQVALVQGSDGNFYGTTPFGGVDDQGTVFKITASGTLTTLYSFTGTNDGGYPYAGLVQGSDGNFYGTTDADFYGSDPSPIAPSGTVFQITPKGALTTLYSFTGGSDGGGSLTALVQGSDGNFWGATASTVFRIGTNGALITLYTFAGGGDGGPPEVALVQGSDGNFYGTTSWGDGAGTLFKISANGAFTTIFTLTNGDPRAALVQGADGNLYGTTSVDYSFGEGNGADTFFKISAGGAFTTLYDFTTGSPSRLIQGTDGNFYGTTASVFIENFTDIVYSGGTVFKITASGTLTTLCTFTNGETPNGLIQGSDGNFYGTTSDGGIYGNGMVFKISGDAVLTSLFSFSGTNDGANPQAGLVQGSDGYFYGTTSTGGSTNGDGTVFKISTTGALTTLYRFTGGDDGGGPEAALVQGSDGNFYGTTALGGTNGDGTIFRISASGALTNLYSFTNMDESASPSGLIQGSDGNFYGTIFSGGAGGDGAVFQLSVGLPPLSASIVIPINAAFGLTNGTFGFDVLAPSGAAVVIQSSSDLQNWIPVQTNLTGGVFHFIDPEPPANHRWFYRGALR
jgi:uncharacterized repeat protein (TIGR03803 family)